MALFTNIIKRILPFVLLIFCFVQCEEKYEPTIDEMPSVLVVEGLISNQNELAWVQLSQSRQFYKEEYQTEPVINANVLIEDKNGERFSLIETKAGYYQSSEAVEGKVHHQYRVVIELENGEKYESDYDKMPPALSVRKTKMEKDQEIVLSSNGNGGFNEETQDGYTLKSSFYSESGYAYYRVDYKVAFQISKMLFFSGSNPVGAYCILPVTSQRQGFVKVIDFNQYGEYFINDLELTFWPDRFRLFEFYLSEELEEAAINKSIKHEGLQLQQSVYSLSEQAFAFWKAIEGQSSASGKLFDPLESNLPGNIKCTSHPEKKALGFFGASAVSVTNEFFHLDMIPVMNFPIDHFPDLDRMLVDSNVFDYWIFPPSSTEPLNHP